MDYRFLKSDDFPARHRTHLEAFSDYAVDSRMTKEQLGRMLVHNGVRYDLSAGAFDGDEMVGFTINGLDQWDGVLTAYDSGTGQSCRRIEAMASAQSCSILCSHASSARGATISIREVTIPGWPLFRSFWDASPSWQNSIESINRNSGHKIVIDAYAGEACVGYGVVSPSSGSIMQLAVARHWRRKGVGTLMLAALRGRAAQPSKINNLDYSIEGAQALCAVHQFRLVVDQYEMIKSL